MTSMAICAFSAEYRLNPVKDKVIMFLVISLRLNDKSVQTTVSLSVASVDQTIKYVYNVYGDIVFWKVK